MNDNILHITEIFLWYDESLCGNCIYNNEEYSFMVWYNENEYALFERNVLTSEMVNSLNWELEELDDKVIELICPNKVIVECEI